MFCEKCGSEIPENSKFCASCGTPVVPVDESALAAEITSQPEPAPAPKVQTPPPAPKPAPAQYSDPNTQYSKGNLVKPLSVGSYMGMFILMAIPIVNLVMLLVWSFSDTVNINKKHFAVGYLIVILIGIVLTVAVSIALVSMGYGIFDFYFNK